MKNPPKRLEEVARALKGDDEYMQSYAARLAIRTAQQRPNQKLETPASAYPQAAQIMRKALLRYVETWCAVKPDFSEWMKLNHNLSARVARAAQQTRYKLLPTKKAGAILARSSPKPNANGLLAIARYDAAWLFIELVTSSVDCEVGQCHRCRCYYLNFSGHRNKVYCSRHCATVLSAEKAMRKRRIEEKRLKLARAVGLCNVWKSKANRLTDWKKWVAMRSELTPKWLTRAVNRGELVPPS